MGSSQSVQEGSVTFSLLELGRLEEQRLREEREAEAARRRQEQEARDEAERRAARELEDRETREAEARRSEERREREEAARVEAIKAAIVEKARKEADARAIAEEREQQHRREVELTSVARGHVEKRLVRISVAQAVALVAVIAGAGVGYLAGIAPQNERRVAAVSAEVAERDQTIASLRAEVASASAALGAAHKDLSVAGDRATSLAAELEQARRDLERARKGTSLPGPVPPVHHGPDTGFSTRCDPSSHDPLCASLGQ
jgi:colicin import membrane protein